MNRETEKRATFGRPLPPGRKRGMTREQVSENQRQRLLAAVSVCLAEYGYEGLSVVGICARARVSRVTFYKHFEDKLECILAAQSIALEGLEARLELAGESGPIAVVEALVEFASSEPDVARLALPCGPLMGPPAFSKRATRFQERLCGYLLAASGGGDDGRSITAEVAAGGLVAVVGAQLATNGPNSLAAIAPELGEAVVLQLHPLHNFSLAHGSEEGIAAPLTLGGVGEGDLPVPSRSR